MQKILTIVIPTYNMQKYLHKCLDSLIVRPDLLNMLEVLVVNDGSKDNSSDIAHGYQYKYPDVFRVIDKENGHYGSCLNRGLAEAKGKYIKVLDADDSYDTVEFEKLLNKLSTIDVDLVLTAYNIVDEDGNTIGSGSQNIPEGEIFDFNMYPPYKLAYYAMYMVTYRTELLRGIGHRQTEGINYTDTEWQSCPQYAVKQFVYYPFFVYKYLKGREGQSLDDTVLIKNVWQLEIVLKTLVENRKKYDVSKLPLADIHNVHQIKLNAITIYKIILIRKKASKEDLCHLAQFDEYLKKSCREVWDDTEKLVVKKWMPIKYVKFWRRTGRVFPLHWLRKKNGNI